MTLYRTRTQEERDTIVANLGEPYARENFLSQAEIQELIELYKVSQNKVEKNTGPVTSDFCQDMDSIPILKTIKQRIIDEVGDCDVYTGFYFHVTRPHIIHNDDDKLGPVIYKAFTLPLAVEYVSEDVGYPKLCFFDQYYLEGPSKFFNGATVDIPTFYNTQVYEYSQVKNKSNKPFDQIVFNKYLTHLKPNWLTGLSFKTAIEWRPGNAIVFDCARLHCASDFLAQGIKSKLGISIFTKLRQ